MKTITPFLTLIVLLPSCLEASSLIDVDGITAESSTDSSTESLPSSIESDSSTNIVIDTVDTEFDTGTEIGTDTIDTVSCGERGLCDCPLAEVVVYDPALTAVNQDILNPQPFSFCTEYDTDAVVYPEYLHSVSTGWGGETDSDGFTNYPTASAFSSGGQQTGFYLPLIDNGLLDTPRTGVDARHRNGLRVCLQGSVLNGIPIGTHVQQGVYDPSSPHVDNTEVQNMVWVYLVTDYTSSNNLWLPGHCTGIPGATESPFACFKDDCSDVIGNGCVNPFSAIPISPDVVTCTDIRWSDFIFPTWLGTPNVDFVMPDVCVPGGTVASDQSCSIRDSYYEGDSTQLVEWHACDEMAGRIINFLVYIPDQAGTKVTTLLNFRIKAELY